VFGLALDLLDKPRKLYRQAGPALRKTMNETIFTKLKLDGAVVAANELAEPFDVIVPAGRAYERRTYQRKRPPALVSGVAFHEGASADVLTSTDLLELALGGMGSSKPVMVGRTGFEPVTSSVSGNSRVSLAVGLSRMGATDLREESDWVALRPRATEHVGSHFWLPGRVPDLRLEHPGAPVLLLVPVTIRS
jgi:hypothetical protein